MKPKEKTKGLRVNESTWRRLMRLKLVMDCKSIDELIERIIKITPASELNKSRWR